MRSGDTAISSNFGLYSCEVHVAQDALAIWILPKFSPSQKEGVQGLP
jgi:hypothetical protein